MSPPTEPSRWQTLQRRIGEQLAQRLFDRLIDAGLGQAPSSAAVGMARALAGLTYLLTLGFAAAGLYLLWRPWTGVLTPLTGSVLLLLAWLGRPQWAKAPEHPLSEGDYPTLYLLGRRMAERLGAPTLAGVAVSAEFNANYRSVGLRGRRYVEIGAPLLGVMTREERIALLAHELAHGANGDPLRGQYLGGAIRTLLGWAQAIRPLQLGHAADNMAFGPLLSLMVLPVELLMVGISELVLLVARGQYLLVYRESQRAEYLADRLAATLVGSVAMVQSLEKLYLDDALSLALRRQALTCPDKPLLPLLRETVAQLPAEELQALREASQLSLAQVDTSHPPTALRVRMLALAQLPPGPALLDDEEAVRFDAEVERLVESQQQELMNRELAGIYG